MDANEATFDLEYFLDNLDQLRNLRVFLASHSTRVNPQNPVHCKALREKVLHISDECSPEVDLSIGKFILSYGGVDAFLKTPIYKISPFVAAVLYVHTMNSREKLAMDVQDLTYARGKELVEKLYHTEIKPPSRLIDVFMTICKSTKEEVDLAIELINFEFPNPLSEVVLKDVKRAVSTHLYESFAVYNNMTTDL